MYMLLVIFLLFTVSFAQKEKPIFSDEVNEILQIVHDLCVEKTGISEEDILNCENGIFKEDQTLKCYLYCLMEEASLVDDNGHVDYETLLTLLPEEYVERTSKMILPCAYLDHGAPEKDRCQRVFDVHKCSYQNDPKLYFTF